MPIVLLVMAFLKPLTSPFTIFIPFFVILAIASASVFEIQLFLNSVTKGKIVTLLHDLQKLIIGIATLLAPLVAYAVVYLASFSHVFAVVSMGGASASELALAVYLLRRNKKMK